MDEPTQPPSVRTDGSYFPDQHPDSLVDVKNFHFGPFAKPAPRAWSVLVVEDDRHHGTTVKDYLTAKGFKVTWVRDGAAAIEASRRGTIDLVLLDVTIPSYDGYEVCRVIKSECGENFIPVVFVTARGAIADKIAGFDAEGDGYITKPYELSVLHSEVRALLKAKRHHDWLVKEKANFERLSLVDPLTGLYNRRVFIERLRYELLRAARYDEHLSLLLIDVDHFKRVNDEEGHVFGDAVLRELSERLRANMREVDLVARYGGEEFVCLLPNTPGPGARVIAERLRTVIESTPFSSSSSPSENDAFPTVDKRSVTVSIGVAAYQGHSLNPTHLIDDADRALYEAKSQGRNRVVIVPG